VISELVGEPVPLFLLKNEDYAPTGIHNVTSPSKKIKKSLTSGQGLGLIISHRAIVGQRNIGPISSQSKNQPRKERVLRWNDTMLLDGGVQRRLS